MPKHPNSTAATWLSAIAVAVIGIAIFMYVVMTGAMSAEDDFFQTQAPGEAVFPVDEAGSFRIFHEFQRTQDSKGMLRPPGIEDLKVQVVQEATGDSLDLAAHLGDTYAIRRTVGESIYAFDAPAPGDYRIITVHPADSSATYGLTIGRPYGQKLLDTLVSAFGILVVTGILVIGVVVLGSRRDAATA